MSGVIPFQFEGARLRVVEIDGETWFVAKDVATILGYENTRKAVSDHCKCARPVRGVTVRSPRSNEPLPPDLDPQTTIIPERDLYRLIMRSRLPAAERFENWVVGEVLPAIRKTGRYQVPVEADANASEEDDPLGAQEELVRLWLVLIREARVVGGKRAAARLWAQSPLPPLLARAGEGASPGEGDIPEVSQVREFLLDRTEAEPSARILGAELFTAYQVWCREIEERPISQNRFGRVLTALGHPRQVCGITFYLGLKLAG
ncbi:MAG: Bro-N domain-containing protein [Alphaproteobacteria bacterium]|nr:Bro-N domain-containing protein [Alphaproteobacteria bacterium]